MALKAAFPMADPGLAGSQHSLLTVVAFSNPCSTMQHVLSSPQVLLFLAIRNIKDVVEQSSFLVQFQ